MEINILKSQEELLKSKHLRDISVREENLEVLDKIKAVPYFPNDFFVGTRQAASYYEVSVEAIKKCIQRHKEEFLDDGVRVLSYNEICKYRELLNTLDDENKSYIGNKAINFIYIPKKALLRLGLLLKKSNVAIQIRTYLLNIEKISTKKQKENALQEISNKQISTKVIPFENYQLEERKLSLKNLELDVIETELNSKKEIALIDKFIRKAILLGIPELEASILVQEAFIENKDIEASILDRLKKYNDLKLSIARGRVRSQLAMIAEELFNSDYEALYLMLSNKLRPILGINMKAIREKARKQFGYHSKKVPSYLDLIADYNAWDIAEKALEDIKIEKLAIKASSNSKSNYRRNTYYNLPEVK